MNKESSTFVKNDSFFKPVEKQVHQKKIKGTNSDNEDDNNLREEIKKSRELNDKFYMKRFKKCRRLSDHCFFLSKLIKHVP